MHAEAKRLKLLAVHADICRVSATATDLDAGVRQILELAASTLDVDGAGLHFLQRGKLVMAHLFSRTARRAAPPAEMPLDADSITGQAVLSRRTIIAGPGTWPPAGVPVAERLGMRWGAATPLIFQGQVLGVLGVFRSHDHAFDHDEITLLESCAAQAAVTLEHVRLFGEQRRHVEELKLLLDVGRAITASLELERVLETAAASLSTITGASQVFVSLLEPDGHTLRGVASSDPELREKYKKVRVPDTDVAIAWEALRTCQPTALRDARDDPRAHAELTRDYGHRALLAVPMLVRDAPIGVIVLSDVGTAREWTKTQIEHSQLVAHQVAVAVTNARLYEDLRQSYDELARTQATLVRRERLAALGELAAVVAHEVRNPLGAICNSVSSLRRTIGEQPAADRLLDIVDEEADRLNRIVGDLLDFARPSEPALRPTAVVDVVASVLEAAARSAAEAGVHLEAEAPAELPTPVLDARLVRQALLNLVLNAIQASPRGGVVRIGTGVERRGFGQLIRIEVVDRGTGIAPDVAPHLFEPFFTTRATGTGLGLAVVKRIIEAHQGTVAYEPAPTQGARFVIRLPLSADAAR